MTTIRNWLNSRLGRAVISDATIALAAGAAVLAKSSNWNEAVLSAAGTAAVKALLRLVVPIPDKTTAVQGPAVWHLHTGDDAEFAYTAPAKPKRLGEYTITRRHIHEHKVEGKPLGRHINHDSRSLDHLVEADGTAVTTRWDRIIAILNQLNVGACTGNAATGAIGTQPDYAAVQALIGAGLELNEAEALVLYSAAEKIDGGVGYPPEDNGSSGLSVAKAALAAGLISGYKHITSLAAAQTAIQTGPFIVGSNWYTGMDTPSSSGLVTATGTVRGGHEYECIGYNADEDLWEFVNSWGTDWGVAGHFFYTSATFATLLAQQGDATVLLPLTTPAPTPPAPVVDNTAADAALVAAATPWVALNHTGKNATMKAALLTWLGVVT